jgi:hypothetical protein
MSITIQVTAATTAPRRDRAAEANPARDRCDQRRIRKVQRQIDRVQRQGGASRGEDGLPDGER